MQLQVTLPAIEAEGQELPIAEVDNNMTQQQTTPQLTLAQQRIDSEKWQLPATCGTLDELLARANNQVTSLIYHL